MGRPLRLGRWLLLACLCAGWPVGGVLAGPEDEEPPREALMARALEVLRTRMDARVGEAQVLLDQGRVEEALAAFRSVETLYREGLEELEALVGRVAGGASAPEPASEPAPGPLASRPAGRAVEAALAWLAAHQSPSGAWEAAGFAGWCDQRPAEHGPDGPGKPVYDVGVTGMALSAFLGAGYTNRGKHPYSAVVGRGLRYLKRVQDPEGCFGPRDSQHFTYNHAAAAGAMLEAYALTRSPLLRNSVQRALEFISLSRNPGGGWRYGLRPGDTDTSVTGKMALVLARARRVDEDDEEAFGRGAAPSLVVDQAALAAARAWFERMTDPDTGRAGYVQRGSGPARPQEMIDRFPAERSEAMTAVAMLGRIAAGEDPAASTDIRRGAALLGALPPRWDPTSGDIDMVYWLNGTRALREVGGDAWQVWRRALLRAAIPNQRHDTDACGYRGSWDPIDPWGPDGGRVYATASMALCLLAAEGPRRWTR